MPSSATQNYMFKAVCETPDLKAFIAASRLRIMNYAMANEIGNGNVGLLLQEIRTFKSKLQQQEQRLLQQWSQDSSELEPMQSKILKEFDLVNRSVVAQEERLAGQEQANSVLTTLLNKDAGLGARSRWIDHVELDMLSALSQTNIRLECTDRETLGKSFHDITGSTIDPETNFNRQVTLVYNGYHYDYRLPNGQFRSANPDGLCGFNAFAAAFCQQVNPVASVLDESGHVQSQLGARFSEFQDASLTDEQALDKALKASQLHSLDNATDDNVAYLAKNIKDSVKVDCSDTVKIQIKKIIAQFEKKVNHGASLDGKLADFGGNYGFAVDYLGRYFCPKDESRVAQSDDNIIHVLARIKELDSNAYGQLVGLCQNNAASRHSVRFFGESNSTASMPPVHRSSVSPA